MNIPFVSIIVPIYNVELYIHDCIDSIICQTYSDWELILIDDGSPDSCPQICDEYAAKDSRIKVIHQKNAGVAAARNAGLNVAQGEWIWFVDSDDWIAKNAVGVLKKNLVYGNQDIVMFAYKRWKNGFVEDDDICVFEYDDFNEFLCHNICFHNQRMLFSKTIIQQNKLRFTEGIRLAEDLEFQYKYEMLCRRPIAINDALYQYRIREGSVTHTDTYRAHAVEDIIKVLYNLLVFIREKNIESEAWLNKRLEMLMKNMLYSASKVKKLDVSGFQHDVRTIINGYRSSGFTCFEGKKIKLAYRSVRLYFIMNKIYLKIKGIS